MTATANLQVCPTCGEDEAFTGTCGTSDHDLRALCKQGQPVQPFIGEMLESRRARYALDQTCTPAFLHWLDTQTPRQGIGANEAWNAGYACAKRVAAAQPVQPAKRVPLTVEQIDTALNSIKAWYWDVPTNSTEDFVRAIEAAHGIKEAQ